MDFFNTSKSIIENLFYLSAPIAVLLSAIGLYQIVITYKTFNLNLKEIKNNSERSAIKFTIEICMKQMKVIDSKAKSLNDKLKTHGIKSKNLASKHIEDFRNIPVEHFEGETLKIILDNYENEFEDLFYDLIESIENFSTPFICGVADENTGFKYDSLKFIDFFRMCSPFFYKIKDELNEDNLVYSNSWDLYTIWNTRTIKDKIQLQEEKIGKSKKKTIDII